MADKLNKYGYPDNIRIDYDIDRGSISFGASMELSQIFDIIDDDCCFVFVDGELSVTITRSAIESLLKLIPQISDIFHPVSNHLEVFGPH